MRDHMTIIIDLISVPLFMALDCLVPFNNRLYSARYFIFHRWRTSLGRPQQVRFDLIIQYPCCRYELVNSDSVQTVGYIIQPYVCRSDCILCALQTTYRNVTKRSRAFCKKFIRNVCYNTVVIDILSSVALLILFHGFGISSSA